MLSFDIRNTISGSLELPIEASASNWKMQIASGGSVTVTIKARDAETKIDAAMLHELTEPSGEFSVAVGEDEVALASGVIIDSDVDDDAGTITLQCADFGDIFWDNRLGAGVGSIEEAGISFANKSAAGATRAVLLRAMHNLDPAHPWWHLPVDLPADGSGGFTIDKDWYEFTHMGELLDMIRQRGYLIHHRPYFTSAGNLRYSTIVAKQIVNGVVPLTYGAAESPITGLKYRRNGQDMVTGVVHAGNGEGEDMITRWAGVPTLNAPVRDRVNTDGKSITNGQWLQDAADADIDENGQPLTNWSLKVKRTDEFALADYLPGETIALDVRDHWIIPDGVHNLQIVSLSGDASGLEATPEVTPIG